MEISRMSSQSSLNIISSKQAKVRKRRGRRKQRRRGEERGGRGEERGGEGRKTRRIGDLTFSQQSDDWRNQKPKPEIQQEVRKLSRPPLLSPLLSSPLLSSPLLLLLTCKLQWLSRPGPTAAADQIPSIIRSGDVSSPPLPFPPFLSSSPLFQPIPPRFSSFPLSPFSSSSSLLLTCCPWTDALPASLLSLPSDLHSSHCPAEAILVYPNDPNYTGLGMQERQMGGGGDGGDGGKLDLDRLMLKNKMRLAELRKSMNG
eukprot:536315-Hanusia_phi.AAC.1